MQSKITLQFSLFLLSGLNFPNFIDEKIYAENGSKIKKKHLVNSFLTYEICRVNLFKAWISSIAKCRVI
jgi:hypothetical protein